jgi:nitrate reductase gamma subunit
MNIGYMYSLIAVIVLFLLAFVGVNLPGGEVFFGIVIPYLAIVIFILGFIAANKKHFP